MNDSRHKLLTIAAVYMLGVLVIGAHVAYTMVVEHKIWEKRSYSNRWAFRDVPTKRGSIRDRQGVLLRADAPTTALEFFYRGFRRADPCGVTVHFANLILASRSQSRRFAFRPDEPMAAFDICASVPLEFLRGQSDPEQARDLQFYTGALISALTATSRVRVAQELQRLLRSERQGSVVVAMGLDPADLREVFRDHRAALQRIVDVLARNGVDLWAKLRDFESERLIEKQTEYVMRVILDGMAYEDAQQIARDQEWHAGFRVRPSVRRSDADVSARWDSLRRLLGDVSRSWNDSQPDLDRRAAILEGMLPELEQMAASGEDVPEDLRDAVAARLKSTLKLHIENHGRVGRSGVEGAADAELRGTAGVQWLAKARRRTDVGLWSTFDVTPGQDLQLTVDVRLQHLLEHSVDDALAGRPPGQNAAAAIVDPATGDILAVVSRPGCEYGGRGSLGLGTAVSWTVNGALGSLAKPLMLAEYLDAKRHGRPYRDHRTFTPCRGGTYMENEPAVPFKRSKLRCDHHHGEQVFRCVESLGVSCNAFFFQVGEGLLRDGVRHAYERFGLYRAEDGPSRFFQGQVAGIPAKSYPDPKWQPSADIQRRAIGYFVEANVLQMARAYCGLATGRLPELSLILRPESGLRFVDLELHPDDLRVVWDGMDYCVQHGTARDLGLVGVFAKTGTAEVGRKLGGGRSNNNAWLAGFVGVAPAKLVFTCVVYDVEHGEYGAKIAGPMFAKFLQEVRSNPELAKAYL